MNAQQIEADFENEVRRISRAKWPTASFAGAAMLDGRERDGVFETEEAINFVEATVSQGSSKAKEDTKKIFKAITDHNKKGTLKIAAGWFVTKNEPTADQRREVQESGKGQVKAVSFSQFQQSLVDVRGYLAARKSHTFGSVQSFISKNKEPDIPFVEIGLTGLLDEKTYLISELVELAIEGAHFAITGHYGAGKSMTLREIFLRLETRYIKGSISKFPVYINLREHSGQKDPVELLERHARNIGFESPSSLIRAWRAGFVILLIDGFDEIASLGVQGSWKKLRDLRMRSLEGVRKLIRDSSNVSVIVAGRAHYFEDKKELTTALGLHSPISLALDEFTGEQVEAFLRRFSAVSSEKPLPDWLPTRPLLLGYLASKGLLANLNSEIENVDAVDGWDYLLTQIYDREQGIETNLDGATLRQILERAATLARISEDGLGPISRQDLFSAFNEVCGYEPDEQGILAIQRLPGLGIYRAEDESRCFVDRELAEVCAGRELFRFLENPYEAVKSQIWVDAMNICDQPLGEIGLDFAARRIPNRADLKGYISQAVHFLATREDLNCTRGDIASMCFNSNEPLEFGLKVQGLNFANKSIQFDSSTVDVSRISFRECFFDRIAFVSGLSVNNLPTFDLCYIERIAGRTSREDLPVGRFSESCEINSYDSTTTPGAIRESDFSPGEKVLLITLRKLFIQSLSGRSDGALYRGLDIDERRYVSDVLKILVRNELAKEFSRKDGVVWLPNRKALGRVKKLLAAPSECNDIVVTESRAL